MKKLARIALGAAAVAFFVGCGGSQPPISTPGAMPQNPAIAKPGDAGSWMSSSTDPASHVPGRKDHFIKALFYAFGDGKLAIFNVSFQALPKLRKLVTIPYTHLHGACSDPSGHVFVTQSGTSGSGEVIEFLHGGTSAVATLSDTGVAMACGYDRSTGNLAVANSYDPEAPGGPGPDIAVYTGETATPTLYADPLGSILSCSYDSSGNLFVGGLRRHGHFVLIELPRGSSAVKAITIDGEIGGEHRREDVQWHDGSLFITSVDRRPDHGTHVFVLSLSGSTATVEGTIRLHTVNPKEKAARPWMALFGPYAVTTDRIGVSAWHIPLHCIGTCYVRRSDRHLLRIANGFVSIATSAIRSQRWQKYRGARLDRTPREAWRPGG
ncbi:MAG TPA: hypothetical protein VHR97_10215 [Candidatus Baltobacteraceae bacterium]|jgi:hypothetical protein|nr:hypothetical protein [Candidatus Baltobacteraceae bacterium]